MTTLSGWRKPASMARGLADCTLIVATYRRPDDVLALLSSLCALPDAPSEVAVVDGSPDDRSENVVLPWARDTDLPFDLLYIRSPAGLTRQRNVGIDATSGDFVFFLDDDCVPEPGYFEAIRACYRSGADGPPGAVCGFVDNEVGRPLSTRWRVRLALGIVPRLGPGAYFPTATSYPYALGERFSGARRVHAMPGCAMSFRRRVLDQHRFSSFFYGYSQGEDLEMSLRVGRESTILWCGDAHAVHHHVPSGRPSTAEKGKMEVRNRYFIWRRFTPRRSFGLHVRFWSDLALGIANDVGAVIAHPTSLAPLRHAAGCVGGMVSCVIAPPLQEEPPAAREYRFELADLRTTAASTSWSGTAETQP